MKYKLIDLSFNLDKGMNVTIPYSHFVSVCTGIAILMFASYFGGKAIASVVYAFKGQLVERNYSKFYEKDLFWGCVLAAVILMLLPGLLHALIDLIKAFY